MKAHQEQINKTIVLMLNHGIKLGSNAIQDFMLDKFNLTITYEQHKALVSEYGE